MQSQQVHLARLNAGFLLILRPLLLISIILHPANFEVILHAIKIIRPFHILIYAVASLMIYLTHFQMNSALEHFGISNNPYASLTAGILGGIVLSKAWQWLAARLKRYQFNASIYVQTQLYFSIFINILNMQRRILYFFNV